MVSYTWCRSRLEWLGFVGTPSIKLEAKDPDDEEGSARQRGPVQTIDPGPKNADRPSMRTRRVIRVRAS